jgi:hypothetical protein
MPGLDDYGALLRSGQGVVPDYAAQEAQSQLLQLKKQEMSANLAEIQRKREQEQQFQDDLHGVLLDPSASNVSALIMKHPEFAEQVKSAWDLKDKAAQKADLTQMGEVYSAASNGKWDLAAQSLQRRIDADRTATGQVDPHDQAILAALNRPTSKRLTAAFSNATTGGGDPASPGAAATAAPGGFDHAVEHVLSNEGGYNPSDMNGAPVNFGINQKANPGVDVKNLTAIRPSKSTTTNIGCRAEPRTCRPTFRRPISTCISAILPFAKKALAESAAIRRSSWQRARPISRSSRKKPSASPTPSMGQSGREEHGDRYWRAHRLLRPRNGGRRASGIPLADAAEAEGRAFRLSLQAERWTSRLRRFPEGPADNRHDRRPTTTFYAQQILAGGQMPTLGMGKQAAVRRVSRL